ncbi:hypothetical protein [Pseudoruegeria sp. HB172150]|uniref:hypothetical protein n=1 Tax=Pseudoruegeria sp. HB172150 TaxID=2721164 RepID=UPI001552381C|nr:hypothetical protein [Pseudoruegeria sp. HB172150]
MQPGIPDQDLNRAVERLEASGHLKPGSRMHRLLTYLLAAETEGRGDEVKAYAIAVDVLDRGEDFDPQEDSIVRVEVGRLRRLLDNYYSTDGSADLLQFRIPSGSSRVEVVPQDAGPEPEEKPPPAPMRNRLLLALAAVVILAAGFAGGGYWVYRRLSEPEQIVRTDTPILEVRSIHDAVGDPDLAYVGPALQSVLTRELSHFRTLRVRSAGPDAPNVTVPGRPGTDFVLSGVLAPGTGGTDLELVLTDDATDTVLWSDRLPIDTDDPELAASLQNWIQEAVVSIAAPGGAIPAEEMRRLEDRLKAEASEDWEYLCYLKWHAYDLTKDSRHERLARVCLEALIERGTTDGRIWAAYAFMSFLDWTKTGAGTDHPLMARAEDAVHRATTLDPLGAEGFEYLAGILLARGDTAAAADAYDAAWELNPSKPDIHVARGWQQMLSGEWDEGLANVRAGTALTLNPPGWFRIPLSIDAFTKGDFHAARTQAVLMLVSGDERGRILAALAAAEAGEQDAAQRHLAELQASGRTVASALDEIRAVFNHPETMAAYEEAASRLLGE